LPRFAQYLVHSFGLIGGKSNWRCEDRRRTRLWTPISPMRLGRKGSQWLRSCQPLAHQPHPRCLQQPLWLRPHRSQTEPLRAPREPQCQGCRYHSYHHCVWDKLGRFLGGPGNGSNILKCFKQKKKVLGVADQCGTLCSLAKAFFRFLERHRATKCIQILQ
jgi:hypothetical protein